MNNFIKGVLFGAGISLLFAPVSGKETRRIIRERYAEWHDSLADDSRLQHYTRQVTDRVAQTKGNIQNYAQEAVTKVKDSSNTSGDKAQQFIQQLRQAGQEFGNKAKQPASSNGIRPAGSSTTRITPETSKE